MNNHFKIVYQPYLPPGCKRKRFLVSANRLKDYIGENNAIKCFERALNSRADKCRCKLRKHGIIDFYVK
jgi:hypothetical protein